MWVSILKGSILKECPPVECDLGRYEHVHRALVNLIRVKEALILREVMVYIQDVMQLVQT